jgi:hypothetical protein
MKKLSIYISRKKHTIISLLSNIKWWFLHRFFKEHRYNYLPTGFPPGYYDPCMQIPATIFESVSTFVKETRGVIDWKLDDGHVEAWKVFCRASIWWDNNKEKVLEVGFDDDETFDQSEIENLLIDVVKNISYMWYM